MWLFPLLPDPALPQYTRALRVFVYEVNSPGTYSGKPLLLKEYPGPQVGNSRLLGVLR